jgi:uncharacterized protein YdeI (YjbR/CyaY-like superfamily)
VKTTGTVEHDPMNNTSPEVDAYIANAPEFARPILEKLRALFHKACPEIEEAMKWSFPHFEYRGVVASMAAFKNYASLGFWKGSLLQDSHQLLGKMGNTSMGTMKVATLADLPSEKILLAYIREAVALNEKGIKVPKTKKPAKKSVEVPEYFLAALKKSKKALAVFEAFPPSHKREYVEWVTEAKQEETRAKRLATAIEWMTEGKSRHWKYQKP